MKSHYTITFKRFKMEISWIIFLSSEVNIHLNNLNWLQLVSIKKAFTVILRTKKCSLHCLSLSRHWPSCSRRQGSGAGAQWPSCRCLWPGLSGPAHSTHRQGCRAQLRDSGSDSGLAGKLPQLWNKIKGKKGKQSSREQKESFWVLFFNTCHY